MIIGLLGNLGRGKTLTMTFLLAKFKYETKIDNVVTNYETDFTTHQIKNEKELDEISQRDDFEAIYGLDEIWAWMNARETQENFNMVEFVLNSRKRGGIIIYSTQSDRQVDPILVDNTDYLSVPYHRKKEETNYDYDIVEILFIEKETYSIVNRYVINAEMYYNTYDTSEEISSVADTDKYDDLMVEIGLGIMNGSYKSITEIAGYLTLNNKIDSENKAKNFGRECIRRLKQENFIERENNQVKVVKDASDDVIEDIMRGDY